jgi:hypothetical protein
MRKEYRKDPDLLAFYAKKLLIRGWAKSMSDAERLYLSNHAEWYQASQERGRQLNAQGLGHRFGDSGKDTAPDTAA